MILPTIRFNSSWELYNKLIRNIHKYPEDQIDPDQEENNAERMISDWMLLEEQILKGMCLVTGLEFRKNIIDVYIAPRVMSTSKPIIIGVSGYDDHFIDEVMFQLSFQLLIDNTSIPITYDVIEDWIEMFSKSLYDDEAYFVPAFAVQKAVCLDVLDSPERLDRIKKRANTMRRADQKTAWEYVDLHDYREIINSLCNMYKAIDEEYS